MDNISISAAKYDELINKLDKLTKHIETKFLINPLPERWLDIQEACQTLNVSKRTLQSYRDNNVLPYSQIGSKIYYKAADIQAHLEKHYKPVVRRKSKSEVSTDTKSV